MIINFYSQSITCVGCGSVVYIYNAFFFSLSHFLYTKVEKKKRLRFFFFFLPGVCLFGSRLNAIFGLTFLGAIRAIRVGAVRVRAIGIRAVRTVRGAIRVRSTGFLHFNILLFVFSVTIGIAIGITVRGRGAIRGGGTVRGARRRVLLFFFLFIFGFAFGGGAAR